MDIVVPICVVALLAGILLLVVSRTVFYMTYRDERLFVSITVLRCGLVYDHGRERAGIACGPLRYYFAPFAEKPEPKKKREDEDREETEEPDKPKSRRLPYRVILRIVKAALVFVGEVLSHIRYDGGRLDVVPVLADPALAGMGYGWSQALYGAFPALRRTVNVEPAYGRGASSVSGYLKLSIRNGSLIGPLWRLARKMPIKQILRTRFTGRDG